MTKTANKEIINKPVVTEVAGKKPVTRTRKTKIGEPTIVRLEEAHAEEARKAAAKVVKAPARKKKAPELKPKDYKTVIKDGLAVAVPKSELKDGQKFTVSAEDKKRYVECIEIVRNFQNATLNAAFALYEINTKGLYRIDGYKNVQELGFDLFGLKKSSVYNLINIVDRFGEKIENGKPVEVIVDQYSGYSQSQLGVMVGHTDDELKNITPEMSVREIKEVLKQSKPDEPEKEPEQRDAKGKSGADDQTPTETEFRANLIHEFATVDEWDNMLNPADELDYQSMCNTIRHCLKQGHKVRILDCFEVSAN